MTPRVSVIVTAYNLARFLPAALDSALEQDWPDDALEVVVIDDGSTDATPDVLAGYADRVRTVRQENAGLVAAVDRGLAEITGDYIAFLDADDEWPADRVRRQVEFLEAHPLVGLVHGDMEVIDEHGATLHPSFFAMQGHEVTDGRVLGRLLAGNFVSGGASMFRASLLPAVHPIAPDAAYPDWWLAANIAAVAEIGLLPGVFNRYRQHGANMGLGAAPEKVDQILRDEIPWRRWMFRHLVEDDSISGAELLAAYRSWEYGLLRAAGTVIAARALAGPADTERGRALAHEGAAALRTGDVDGAARRLMRALAEDPWDGAARIDLELALRAAAERPGGTAAPATALSARRAVTLAWAPEIIHRAELLRDYAAGVDGGSDATLVVLTTSDAELTPLMDLVSSLGLDTPGAADLLAYPAPSTTPARRLIAARAVATLGPLPVGWLPVGGSAGR